MEQRPDDRPSWLPATRPPSPPPGVVDSAPDPAEQKPSAEGPAAVESGATRRNSPRPRFNWRTLTRSPRGAAGLVIAVAALLLWPFSGWSAIPWLVGIGLLVLLRLLRLDGLLRGWALHVGGLAVVIGLMVSTSPWAWALAASIGVLLAGLAQLPWWRLAAVGAVMCLVSGAGFGWSSYQDRAELAESRAQSQLESRGAQGAERPQGVLPIVLNRISQNVPGPVCDNLLAEPARSVFVASSGEPDCPAAVGKLSAQVSDRAAYARADAPSVPTPDGLLVDACSMSWRSGEAAGPQIGRLTVGQKVGGRTYVVTDFSPCQ